MLSLDPKRKEKLPKQDSKVGHFWVFLTVCYVKTVPKSHGEKVQNPAKISSHLMSTKLVLRRKSFGLRSTIRLRHLKKSHINLQRQALSRASRVWTSNIKMTQDLIIFNSFNWVFSMVVYTRYFAKEHSFIQFLNIPQRFIFAFS